MDINITLIGQMITFAIFVGFTMKFVWPPLRKALDERREKIAEGLASAEKASIELASARKQAEKILNEAKDKASEIIENANIRANKIDEQAKEEAIVAAENIKKVAFAEIEQEKAKAKEQLKQEIVSLAMIAAGKIIAANVDEKVSKKVLQDFVEKL